MLDLFSQNSMQKVAHGPRKKLLDFGGNLDTDPGIFETEFLPLFAIFLLRPCSRWEGNV